MSQTEATTSKPASDGKAESTGATPATHPLEHKWTLWFDNPKGSQRQVSHLRWEIGPSCLFHSLVLGQSGNRSLWRTTMKKDID